MKFSLWIVSDYYDEIIQKFDFNTENCPELVPYYDELCLDEDAIPTEDEWIFLAKHYLYEEEIMELNTKFETGIILEEKHINLLKQNFNGR